jgi:uncharacterized protein with PIN domain
VYPVFESIDISPLTRVRPAPLRQTRFVLDMHLGRLAAYLRLLGFDTWYQSHSRDEDLARASQDEHRILLTRDRGLLKRAAVTHGHLMRETFPRRQLAEVVERFDLYRSVALFTRCLRCNTPLRSARAESVADRLPERTRRLHTEFFECDTCRRVYWKGSHYARMRKMIGEVLKIAS